MTSSGIGQMLLGELDSILAGKGVEETKKRLLILGFDRLGIAPRFRGELEVLHFMLGEQPKRPSVSLDSFLRAPITVVVVDIPERKQRAYADLLDAVVNAVARKRIVGVAHSSGARTFLKNYSIRLFDDTPEVIKRVGKLLRV